MAERVVQVTIRASVDKYITGMERARKATAAAASESETLERVGQAADKVGTAMGVMGAASVAAVGYMVKVAADFDAQMSKVQAATGATTSEMAKFRNQALTAGAAFGYTASQVTEAQIELGKAGLATKDILGGALQGTLALAASDNIDLGKATQIAAVAMKQFKLEGQDVPHIADLLAAGAGKALGGVEQLGDALNQSGLVASNFGFSLEETTGVLSAFADQGLLGSDAGTSLKTMLQALANPSKESAQLMKSLGVNVQDANGQFLGAADLSQQLHDKLSTLTDAQRQQALAQIFGSDATRAATVLMKEAGGGIQKYIDQNNDAGYAMEQASKKSNNLNGDLKRLQSAFQSGLIDTGTSASSALRPVVQNVTRFIQAINEMPEPLKAAALGTTAVVGGATLLGGGLLIAIPKIVEFRAALATLAASGITGRAALSAVATFLTGPYGIALAAGSAAIVGLNVAAHSGAATQDELKNAFISTADAAKVLRKAGERSDFSKLIAGDTEKRLQNLKAVINELHGQDVGIFSAFAVKEESKSLQNLGGALAQIASESAPTAAKAFSRLRDQQKLNRTETSQLIDLMPEYKSELTNQASALGISASKANLLKLATGQYEAAAKSAKSPTQGNADALSQLQEAAGQAAPSIEDVANALKGLTSPTLDAREARRQFQAAVDAVSTSVKDNGTSLDISTEKGRANQAALDGLAQSAQNVAGSLFTQTGSQEKATAAMQAGRDELVRALGQYGITGAAAQAYADNIIGTPKEWASKFTNNADAASEPVKRFRELIQRVPGSKNVTITANTNGAQLTLNNFIRQNDGRVIRLATVNSIQEVRVGGGTTGNVARQATGGIVRGPGSGTSDSVPAMLSNGEYVIRQSSVAKYGTGFLDAVNRGYYANGGLVSSATTANTRAKNSYKAAQDAQRRAQRAFDKSKSAADRARLVEAQQKTKDAKAAAQRAAAALARAKAAPTGADLGDRISFRSSVLDGSFDAGTAVNSLYSMAQDTSKYGKSARSRFLDTATRHEKSFLALQKRSEAAAKAVETASDKLGDLKSSAASMASGITGKLTDVPYGNYRSGSALQRALTSRASKLKQFQTLLGTLQKNGIAPALLNEVASLGVDQGLPLAKSLATMSKSQLSAINTQYATVQGTSTAIGNQVADANYGKLIDATERQLSAANKNADKIAKAIADQSKALQKFLGKALGVKGYSAGGYTGNGHPAEIAGVVHGREFVMNQYATARNRPYLEALNNGGSVRYMDPTPIRSAVGGGGNTYEQHNHFQPMPNLDENTIMEVVGRQTARAFAGMPG